MSDLSELMNERAANAAVTAAEESMRPFYMLKPRVFPDGNMWIALYGANIQEGICGCGDTPAAAASDFDNSFFSQKLMTGAPNPLAAPELLEALENLIEAIPGQNNDQDWWPDALTRAVREAKAMIAKAEGK